MPKLKTHSGSKDRVRVSKNGKVLGRKGGSNHFLEKKSMSRKRTYSGFKEIIGNSKKIFKKKIGV